MKKLFFLMTLVFLSSCVKKEQKEDFSTIIINLGHSQHPTQIIIDIQKSQIGYQNLNVVLAASADADKTIPHNQIVSLDKTSLSKIMDLFYAIHMTPQERNKSAEGMYSSIEAHSDNGKVLNMDQLNDRHADEIAFFEAVLKTIAKKSKDPNVQREMDDLIKGL
ncbi:hypothetical protein [Flavobacterium lindanitolerans]|uniref:hypothetical protein n=1 Tax=Flavobacterium lindanitolerans TaxID=428988 RepID=UPI0028087E71|nr:hypothetical protein [Flavobacterium lindanitolerans]MDQ7961970.1 hypothetical protein [Flavobacterium lindanitolerans]